MNKTYQNTQVGFAMDVPENWVFPSEEAIKSPFGVGVFFYTGPNEVFNIQIGQSKPESLDELEQEFRRYALGRPYIGLEFGRITASNKNHLWARYRLKGDWTKKYLIVLGNSEYDLTATCFDQHIFVEREVIWDKVVQSFRLTTPVKPGSTSNILDRMNQASKFFQIGNTYFTSGEYRKALEQFEQGKMVTHEFPWNFLGASMTTMQMLEKGLIPTDQIRQALKYAEGNLEMCLLISPQEQDYIDRMKAIQEFKKKHSL